MNNLEQRIREHYTRELHPMVFALLDEVQLGANPINVRYVKSLEAENARLRAAIAAQPCPNNDKWCDIHRICHDEMHNGCWKSKALENPND